MELLPIKKLSNCPMYLTVRISFDVGMGKFYQNWKFKIFRMQLKPNAAHDLRSEEILVFKNKIIDQSVHICR